MKGIEFRLPRGGVVAGHVFDEDGEPMPGAVVRVMRYQYLQGDRRLTPAGTAQTDDKGQYRVWGLNPGDYYINAVTRIADFGRGGGPGGGRGGPGGAVAGFIDGALGGNIAAVFGAAGDDQDRVAYAPTYFPGVGSVAEARPVVVGLSQEVLDVDFNLQLVRTSRINGHVTNPDGTPTTSGNVNLTPEGVAGAGRGQIGINYGGRIEWDGDSRSATCRPAATCCARAATTPSCRSTPCSRCRVSGGEINDLPVVLMPGASLIGSITFRPRSCRCRAI